MGPRFMQSVIMPARQSCHDVFFNKANFLCVSQIPIITGIRCFVFNNHTVDQCMFAANSLVNSFGIMKFIGKQCKNKFFSWVDSR